MKPKGIIQAPQWTREQAKQILIECDELDRTTARLRLRARETLKRLKDTVVDLNDWKFSKKTD